MKNEKGFSLIELLIVVALIAIVAAIAMWGTGSIQGRNLTAASKQLYGDLQKTRIDAMTQSPSGANSRGFGIRFVSNTTYTVFEFNDANGDFQYAGTGEETNTRQVTLPSGVTVTVGDAGDPTLAANIRIYDKGGMIRNTSWSIGNTQDIKYVLSLSGVSQKRCVKIETVRIREGVWDGNNCQSQ